MTLEEQQTLMEEFLYAHAYDEAVAWEAESELDEEPEDADT